MSAKDLDVAGLLELAKKAALASYSPYSQFRVGAALLCADGTVITGTNVENRSFGLTVCAERNAVFQAVSRGFRAFMALGLVCLDAQKPVSPCGACRQVLSEFVGTGFPVYFSTGKGDYIERTMAELLPDDALHDQFK